MATTLGYSTIEQTNTTTINNEDSQNIHEQRRKNKTIKNRCNKGHLWNIIIKNCNGSIH